MRSRIDTGASPHHRFSPSSCCGKNGLECLGGELRLWPKPLHAWRNTYRRTAEADGVLLFRIAPQGALHFTPRSLRSPNPVTSGTSDDNPHEYWRVTTCHRFGDDCGIL